MDTQNFDDLWNQCMGSSVPPAEYAAQGWDTTRILADLRELWGEHPTDRMTEDEIADVANAIAAGLEALGLGPTIPADVGAFAETIVIRDCMPMMADVASGREPRPVTLPAGDDPLVWARATPAVRRLCRDWGGDVSTVETANAATAALSAAIGDCAAVVAIAGRLVALNSDGTRAAYQA